MQRLRVLIVTLIFVSAAAAAPGSARGQEAPERVTPGGAFPPLKVKVLRPGGRTLRELDLGSVLGRRPIVITYFMMGESLGEEVFLEVQELAGELEGKIEIFGAFRMGRSFDMEQAADRLELFGVTVPVIVEERMILGNTLGIRTAPSINLIDHNGVLRIADAKSLKQKVASAMTMKDAIRNAARRGPVPVVQRLPRYYPANELVGEPFPDFMLKQFKATERLRLSDHVGKEKKVTGLLFWHPNCKHCKKAMPGIVVGYNSYRKWIDVISVVALKDANEVRNAEDTVRAHKIEFPVLEDEGRRITDLYKVVSTPTMFFIRPDGIIDSVYTRGDINYVPVFSSRIRSILKVGREYESGGAPGGGR